MGDLTASTNVCAFVYDVTVVKVKQDWPLPWWVAVYNIFCAIGHANYDIDKVDAVRMVII